MRNRDSSAKIANYRRKNLIGFTFLTKKQSPHYLEIDASNPKYHNKAKISLWLLMICLASIFTILLPQIYVNLVLGKAINLLVSIQPLAQCQMPNLRIIHLQGNEITQIEPLVRCRFPLLENLLIGFSNRHFFDILGGNNIKSIEELKNCNFPQLKELAFDCNEIVSVRPLQVYPFREITLLYFAKNMIQTIPEVALSGFPNLKLLSFKNNSIRSLRFLAKPKLLELTYVNMEDNEFLQLKQIHRYGMKKLGKIVFSLNNVYCPQNIMKADWPCAAGFNLVQKEEFDFGKPIFRQIYNKFLANEKQKQE